VTIQSLAGSEIMYCTHPTFVDYPALEAPENVWVAKLGPNALG